MIIEKHKRFFLRNELTLRPRRGRGAAVPLISSEPAEVSVHSLLNDMLAKDELYTVLRAGDILRVTSVELDLARQMLIVLFRRRDANAAPQVLEHAKTRALRTPERLIEEDPAVSAHLFISLEERYTPNPTYRAILEEVPGIGRTYVQYLLDTALAEHEYEYEDEKRQKGQTTTKVDLMGLPAHTVGDALNGGSIGFIELVRKAKLDGLDDEGLIPRPERMRFTLRRDPDDPLSIVQRVKEWAFNKGWEDVRILVNTAEERSRVVNLERQGDAADALFVRAEPVTTDGLLAVCADDVNDELAGLAGAMFADAAGWA